MKVSEFSFSNPDSRGSQFSKIFVLLHTKFISLSVKLLRKYVIAADHESARKMITITRTMSLRCAIRVTLPVRFSSSSAGR